MQDDIKTKSNKKGIRRNWYIIMLLIAVMIIIFSIKVLNNGVPDDILPPSVMKSIIWDHTNAEVYLHMNPSQGNRKNDSIAFAKIQKAILKKHQIEKKVYDKSYDYYQEHPRLLYSTIEDILKEKQLLVFGDSVKTLD